MKISLRKILLALTLVLVLTVALAVAAVAADYDYVPSGVTKGDDSGKWVDSGYTDVDTGAGWYYMGASDTAETVTEGLPELVFVNRGRFYWHKTDRKAVWIATESTLSADDTAEEQVNETQNCVGQVYKIAWVLEQLGSNGYIFDSLEIRLAEGSKTYRYAYLNRVLEHMRVTTVLFDSRIVKLAIYGSQTKLAGHLGTLTTFAHVTYDGMTGNHSEYTDDVVDLRGFTEVDVSGSTFAKGILREYTSVKNVIWFSSIINGEVDYAGIIDDRAFCENKGLETFTMTTQLTQVVNYAFYNCTSLKTIDLRGGISESCPTIAKDQTFNGVKQAITVYVYSEADAETAERVFGNYSNITIERQAATGDRVLGDALVAKGASVKIKHSTSASDKAVAIRFLFTLDAYAALENLVSAGYTPLEVGVIACNANNYTNADGTTENEKVVALIEANAPSTLRRTIITVNNAETGNISFADGAKFLSTTNLEKGIFDYAYTLYGVPEKNYTSRIYASTYVKCRDLSGNERYFAVSCHYLDGNDVEQNTMSLYDATLGLYAKGLINLEGVEDDKYLWGVLKTQMIDLDDTVEGLQGASTATNCDYFFLPNMISGKNVAVFRRAASAEASDKAYINNRLNAGNPYAEYPALYTAVETVIVDYGINAVEHRALGDATAATTIVYPSGVYNDNASYLFLQNKAMTDAIWCHYDEKGNAIPHMSDIEWNGDPAANLLDLRGFEDGVTVFNLTYQSPCISNIVVRKFNSSKEFSLDASWLNNRCFYRIWSTENYGKTADGKDIAPADLTIDLRSEGITAATLDKDFNLNILKDGYTVYYPTSLEAASESVTGTRITGSAVSVTVHSTAKFQESFEALLAIVNKDGGKATVITNHADNIEWVHYDLNKEEIK